MSGLSNAVIIAEAAEHSGTMATATYALKQSKELYVVPGDINRPNSKGCNKMLENANAYYDFDLFVKLALGMDSKKKRVVGLPVKQQQIADYIEQGVKNGETIAQNLNIGIAEFNQLITLMELKDIVRPLGCNQWTLV